MKQGKRSVTEYCNEFRLAASEAELDDSTGGELLLGGMITELQNAWGASSEEYEGLEALAQWAIRKETKLATVRHIQGSPSTKSVQRETITQGNPDSTYRTANNSNQTPGNPIEQDATRNRPRFNISREKLQRRMREQLCLKCAKQGHLARDCSRRDEHKPFNAQAKSWQPAKKTARGKPDRRSRKSRSNKNPNSRETTKVPSKRWCEGQARTKTHHHRKLLRGTQLHKYTRKRQ